MKWQLLARATLMLLLLALLAPAQNRYLVRVHNGSANDVASRHGLRVERTLQGSGSGLYVMAPLTGSASESQLSELSRDASIANAELDGAVTLPEKNASASLGSQQTVAARALVSRAGGNYYGSGAWTGYINQPAAAIIRLPEAHGFASGAGTVAFLDTGVDPKHPVLASSLVPGYDFTRGVPGGSELADLTQSTTAILDQSTTAILDQSTTAILDGSIPVVLNQSTTAILDQSTTAILDSLPPAFGHGTMVAGLIHLVAPTARLMPVKVFAGDGTSSISQIVAGIYYAVDSGAKVISMSFSAPQSSQELMRAINYANSQRVICVASAGNNSKDILVYPAAYKQVVGVASTDNNDVRSWFSNYGDVVSVAGPGNAVVTTYPGAHYAAASGTSFSAPLVSGGAALFAQIQANTNGAQAQSALAQAVPVGQGLGAGRIDLYRACAYAATHGPN